MDETFSYCSMPPVAPRELPAGMDPARLEAIVVNESKWVNHTVLHYYFFDRETDGEHVFGADGTRQWRPWTTDKAHQDVVRNAFDHWEAQGIGLEFVEVTSRDEAEIRVGFMEGDGAWSYLGRQILDRGANERTMNFGWDLLRTPREADTALHEIGHTLGLPHEHQNPNAGIVWDEEKVYTSLGGPPNNWPRSKTQWNILRKIEPDTVQGSNWDPDSIMHYPFQAGLILEPERFQTQPLRPAGGLSARDLSWVRAFYPGTRSRSCPSCSRSSPASWPSCPVSSATSCSARPPPASTRSRPSGPRTPSWCCSSGPRGSCATRPATTTAARTATPPSSSSSSRAASTSCGSASTSARARARRLS